MQVLQDRETAGHKLVADKLAVEDRLTVGDSLVVVEDKLAVDHRQVDRSQVAGGKLARKNRINGWKCLFGQLCK